MNWPKLAIFWGRNRRGEVTIKNNMGGCNKLAGREVEGKENKFFVDVFETRKGN